MNINEEGKYYASMVRKFRTEYNSKNLRGFCKEQKESYTKMLHCIRDDSYRKSSIKPVAFEGEQGLRPLVVDRADSEITEPAVSREAPLSDMLLDDIDISFGTKVSLHIGICSKSALVSLIKEMEEALC